MIDGALPVPAGRPAHVQRLLGEGLRTGVAEAVRLMAIKAPVHLCRDQGCKGGVLFLVA